MKFTTKLSKAEWIEVKSIQNPAGLLSAQRKYGLGSGEMSAIILRSSFDSWTLANAESS